MKKQIISGYIWSFSGQILYLLIGLATNIVLVNQLSPNEFGRIGIVMFFILLGKVLSESGLGGALVRNNKATDIDYSTIFIFNILISTSLSLILFFSSAGISSFYNDRILTDLLKVSSLIILISSFQVIQNTRLIKSFNFKRKAIYELTSVSLASILAILLVFNNYGVWSILAFHIGYSTFLTLALWIFESKFTFTKFNYESLKFHLGFGLNTTGATLIQTAFDNLYSIVLSKFFLMSQAGLFYQAKKLQEVPVGLLNKLIQGPSYSTLSKVQEDNVKFEAYYKQILLLFTVSIGLICIMSFLFSEEIIELLFGDNWIKAASYLQILSIASFFYLQESINRLIYKVYNRTDLILKLELVKKGIQLISIIIGVWLRSIDILLFGFVASNLASYIINVVVSKRVKVNDIKEELILIFKVVVLSVVITFSYWLLKSFTESITYELIIFILTIITYFLLLRILRIFSLIHSIKTILLTLKHG